ncbi:MAG TPA: nucleoside deaminase [Alphaproteobacteria bacterium]|nr:nucleoside deaminase [Alphaproteobacteria bacterium]
MPLLPPSEDDRRFMRLAIAEAEKTLQERGVPVGSVMVRDGEVVAVGRNRAFQTNDPTSHGETDCIRNAGFIDGFERTTLYTTLSPCMMCTGAMLFLGIPKAVIGDRETYPGDIDFLLARGMQIVLLDDPDCIGLMRRFITGNPELWQRITAGDPP